MDLPRKQLFTTRTLILLSIPAILEQTLANVVGLADSVMVSSVGEAAISGVSLVDNVSGVILNLLTSLSIGGGIVTSQLIGAGNYDKARRSAGQNITMTVSISILIGFLCAVFSRQIISLFFGHIEQDVMEACLIYMFWQAVSFPFLGLYSAGAAILRAGGDTKTAFYVSLLRNGVNIAGNAICIFGLKMGVSGVAIPTAISRFVGAAAIVWAVMKSKASLHPNKNDIFHIDSSLMGRMFRLGMPTALENSIFQIGRVLTMSMVSLHGTVHIAANATASQLTGLANNFTQGVRTASMTVIGQCVGAGDEDQIKRNFRKLLIMSYLCNFMCGFPMMLFRHSILGLYATLSPETLDLAAKLMLINLGFAFIIYTPSWFIVGPLRAANDTTFPMVASIISMFIFRLTLAQILCVELGWGVVGVWYAMIVDWAFRAVIFTIRWYSGAWKKRCHLHA